MKVEVAVADQVVVVAAGVDLVVDGTREVLTKDLTKEVPGVPEVEIWVVMAAIRVATVEEVAEDMVVVMAITRVVTGVETREATMKDTEVDMEEDKVETGVETNSLELATKTALVVV